MSRLKINIPQDKIAEFCRRNHIMRLSVFGSALREDFDMESDVDVLVELNPPGAYRNDSFGSHGIRNEPAYR